MLTNHFNDTTPRPVAKILNVYKAHEASLSNGFIKGPALGFYFHLKSIESFNGYLQIVLSNTLQDFTRDK